MITVKNKSPSYQPSPPSKISYTQEGRKYSNHIKKESCVSSTNIFSGETKVAKVQRNKSFATNHQMVTQFTVNNVELQPNRRSGSREPSFYVRDTPSINHNDTQQSLKHGSIHHKYNSIATYEPLKDKSFTSIASKQN